MRYTLEKKNVSARYFMCFISFEPAINSEINYHSHTIFIGKVIELIKVSTESKNINGLLLLPFDA